MTNSITIKEMRKIVASPFFSEMTDENKVISVNGVPTAKGYWNLILSIRDVNLYSKGIKPHRYWKIGDVKNYFGISGSAPIMANKLEELKDIIITGDVKQFNV